MAVIGKVTPVNYLVGMPERHRKHCTVHVEALKKWFEPSLSIISYTRPQTLQMNYQTTIRYQLMSRLSWTQTSPL